MSKMVTHAQMKKRARQYVKDLESKYEAGDMDALLDAIFYCSLYKIALPRWAVNALGYQIHRVRSYQVKSWDDIFGKPLRKGQWLSAARQEYKLMRSVPLEIWWLTEHKGLSLTEAYSAAAKKLKSDPTTVRQIYYKVRALLR